MASAPALTKAAGRSRSALSVLLVLFSILLLALPSAPSGLWAVGMSTPVSTPSPDAMSGQSEPSSSSATFRPEVDEAPTPWSLPAPRMEGASTAPTLRGRSALSLGISAMAPLRRPPRLDA